MTGGRFSGESKFEGFTIISSWLELEEPTSSTPWFSVSESCRTSSLIVCRLSGNILLTNRGNQAKNIHILCIHVYVCKNSLKMASELKVIAIAL